MGFDHRLWQIVKLNCESLEANAPEGHVAQARSYLAGDPTPIPIRVVEAHRNRGWIMLQSLTEGRNEPDVVAGGRPTEAVKLEHR